MSVSCNTALRSKLCKAALNPIGIVKYQKRQKIHSVLFQPSAGFFPADCGSLPIQLRLHFPTDCDALSSRRRANFQPGAETFQPARSAGSRVVSRVMATVTTCGDSYRSRLEKVYFASSVSRSRLEAWTALSFLGKAHSPVPQPAGKLLHTVGLDRSRLESADRKLLVEARFRGACCDRCA